MRLAAPLLVSLLHAVLLVGEAAGMDGKRGKGTPLDHFMEEVRGALAGQWDLLQNLRYHTLSMKVRLIQLEAQLQNLSKHLDKVAGNEGADTHSLIEKDLCDENNGVGDDAVEDIEEKTGDDDIQDLLEAMRNLTEVYSTLDASNRQCGRTDFEGDREATLEPRAATTTGGKNVDQDKDDKKEKEGEVEEGTGKDQHKHKLSHNANVTALLGSLAVLNCRLDQLRDPEQAAWVRERDQNWLSQGRHKVAADEERISVAFSDEDLNFYRLYLQDVRQEDEGAYECHLSTTPAVRQTIWLTVLEPTPSPPLLEEVPRDRLVVEGINVTLICRASGYPKPSVTWTRNSLQISSTARHHITPAGDLIIRGVRRSDAGRYGCQVVNINGRVEGAVLLTVRQATRILRPPRDKELLVGESVVMRCRAKGDEGTPLLVEWLKDGEVINVLPSDASDSRFSRLANNALVVTYAQVEDSGLYTCRASTPFDVTFANASLVVKEAVTTTTTTSTTTIATTNTILHSVLHLDYCPPPFERIHKYVCVLEITHVKLKWEDAAEYCREEGGQLAWENEDERILQDFLERRYGHGWIETSANTGWPFWVGGREDDREEWRWMDGSLVSAGVWAPQHRRPSGRRAANWCLILDGYQGYLATALRCDSKRYFLCRLK